MTTGMDHQLRRPKAARVYAWLVSAVPVLFVLIAGLVGAGLGIDAHRGLGEIFGILAIVGLLPLAFRAGFPGHLRVGPLTALLVALWMVQLILGLAIEEHNRWAISLHIPNAFLIFGLSLLLAVLAQRAVRKAPAPEQG